MEDDFSDSVRACLVDIPMPGKSAGVKLLAGLCSWVGEAASGLKAQSALSFLSSLNNMAQCHAGESLAEAAVRGQIGQASQNSQNTCASGLAVRASKLAAQKKSDTSDQ